MKFKIITKSTFENVYYIEASSKDEAINEVMNTLNPPDFFQKHLGESVVSINEETLSKTDLVNELRKAGYF